MKYSRTIALIIGALCLLATVNSQCVTLYSRYNRQGSRLNLCDSGDLPGNWNNQVSSFVVAPGYTVSLYEDSDFGGQEYGPYNAGTYNVSSNFDDEASSIRIFAASNCPTFYSDYSQEGDNYQQCTSGDVPSNWNDQISSFVVPQGYTIQIYGDYSFESQLSDAYNAGNYTLPPQYNDQISSIRVFAVNKCPVFYTDYNQTGDSFQQCTSGNTPSALNDQVSSFVVPPNYSITFYTNDNYGGGSFGPYRQGSYNVPTQYNGQLRSFKVFIV